MMTPTSTSSATPIVRSFLVASAGAATAPTGEAIGITPAPDARITDSARS